MLGVCTIWYVLVVCTSCIYYLYVLVMYQLYLIVVCIYILVFNINSVLDVYSSCMFYIVLCNCSMN